MPTMAGPMSKGTHADGPTFTPKPSIKSSVNLKLSNSSEGARKVIMGMRVPQGSFGGDPATVLRKRPPEKN